jgi:hypothetical protein
MHGWIDGWMGVLSVAISAYMIVRVRVRVRV